MSRRLYVCRHGERVDHVFQPDWMDKYLKEDGSVNWHNINLPKSLPKRQNVLDYVRDSPLTTIGLYQATLTGEALKEADVTFSHVFCSPAYRCIQTGTNILKAMGLKEKAAINVEPGLFEWIGPVYRDARPKWFLPLELKEIGFNINTDYQPLMKAQEIQNMVEETCKEWYERANKIASVILDSLENYTNVLFVAHGGSLDPLTRQLSGRPPRCDGDLAELVPYCGIITLIINDDGTHKVAPPPIPTLFHKYTIPFNWEDLAKETPESAILEKE